MTDRWQSKAIQCKGGLILNVDALTQGTNAPGSARVLQNYEPSIDGGYKRLTGYIKYDTAAVTGGTNNAVLGVKVAFSGVFACRLTNAGTDNAIYYSTSAGWTRVNTTLRPGAVTKARFITYSISAPVLVQCDGINYAWKWDGATETTINGTGAPANPKFAALFKNRLVLAGYSSNTSAISLSVPNTDTSFDGSLGALEMSVGDVIVGLKTFRDDLYIFCQKSIHKLAGNTSADFQIEHIAGSLGCVSGDTIQEIGGDLIYLSHDSFRSIAATVRIGDVELGALSEPIQPLVRAVLNSSFTEDVYSSCLIKNKNQYRLFVNDPNAIEEETIGFIGKLNGAGAYGSAHDVYEWATLRGIKPYCADTDVIINQELQVFGHPTNGYVYRLESGNTFDGTNINAIYRSPDLTFDDASIRKVFQKGAFYTQVDGDTEFLVNLKFDREATGIIQPDGITLSQMGTVPVYGTAVYDTDAYGEVAYPVFYSNLIGSGLTVAFLFTSDNADAPHRIDSYQVQFSTKGRR